MTTRWLSLSVCGASASVERESAHISKNVLNTVTIAIEAKSVYSEQLLIVYMLPNFFPQGAIG